MSRPYPTLYAPVATQPYSASQPIHVGSDTGKVGEADLAENLHFVVGRVRPPIVNTIFASGDGYAAGDGGSIRALWVVPIISAPWTHYRCVALVQNTGTDVAVVTYELASGGIATGNVAAGAAAWTVLTVDLAIDTARDFDVVQLRIENGPDGELRVHSVTIYPQALASIPGEVQTFGDARFCPIDSTEVDGHAPLSVAVRTRLLDGIEFARRTRIESVIGWAANTNEDGAPIGGGGYTFVARIPFRPGAGQTQLRWAAIAEARSEDGVLRLTTTTQVRLGLASLEVPLVEGWTSPYDANLVTYADSDVLPITEHAAEELLIELSFSALYSFSAWLWRP